MYKSVDYVKYERAGEEHIKLYANRLARLLIFNHHWTVENSIIQAELELIDNAHSILKRFLVSIFGTHIPESMRSKLCIQIRECIWKYLHSKIQDFDLLGSLIEDSNNINLDSLFQQSN
jgi:hypothetical protein